MAVVKFRYRIQTNTTIDLEDACADELKNDPVQTALLDIASLDWRKNEGDYLLHQTPYAYAVWPWFRSVEPPMAARFFVGLGRQMNVARTRNRSWSHRCRSTGLRLKGNRALHLPAEPYQVIPFYCGRGRMENYTACTACGYTIPKAFQGIRLLGMDQQRAID